MTAEQYEQRKQFDIQFVEQMYNDTKKIRPQMNICTDIGGRLQTIAVGGIDLYGREFFYDKVAPHLLKAQSELGQVVYVSLIIEAELREPDIIDGKMDLKNYRSKPAKDAIVITFMTPEKTEVVVFYIQDGKLVREQKTPEKYKGMMPNILKRFLEQKA